MATTIVKDTAGLTAALKSAQAGDTIKLAAGDYAALNLSGLKFAGQVTVTSLDANNPAALTGMMVKNSENLTFSNLDFKVDAAKADYPFQVLGSKNISLDNLNVYGSLDGNEANDIAALMIRNSDNVTVSNSEFQQLRHGIAHLDSSNLKITDNYFHEIRTDGVRGGGSSNVEISGNYFTNFNPIEGDHADAIQFWTTNTTTSAANIVVKDNVVTRGDGEPIQGVFFRDQVGGLPFTNVQIVNNLVVGGSFNGISTNGAKDVLISGNTVVGLPDQASRILLADSDGVQMVGNTATQYVVDDLTTSVESRNNGTVAVPKDGGAALQASWYAKSNIAADALNAAKGLSSGIVGGIVNVDALTLQILNKAAALAVREIENARAVMMTVNGTAGNDVLKVSSTQDTFVSGGAGNDLIYGGGVGHNTLSGGAGDDTYYVKSVYDQVVEDVNGGYDLVSSSVDFVLGANIEQLRLTGEAFLGEGNDLDNRISGTDEANELRGHGGNDMIQAAGGDDRLYGGAGNDTLVGGDGNDYMQGDAGSDKLVGGAGDDVATGGDGADTLEGGAGADTLSGGAGADMFIFREGDLSLTPDRILDFSRLDGDKISLQGIDANVNVAGDQKFAFIGTAQFSNVAGQLRMDVAGSETTFSGDWNGDGVADFKLIVMQGHSLTASDFIL